MPACQTCGGFGMHHDPIAHDEWTEGDECRPDCNPADLRQVASDEVQCVVCGYRRSAGED